MDIWVEKRNNDKELYNIDKLEKSIKLAFKVVKSPFNRSTLKSIISKINIENNIKTLDIRDQLEFVLMEHGYYNVAKAFITHSQNKIASERDTSDKLKFLESYCNAINSASGSQYDANSNVESKNIATLAGELPKRNFIEINRKLLYNRLRKNHNKKTADLYLKMLNDHFIYSHDETSIAPYCCSITLYPWLLNGTKSIGGNSTAPTNLKSFCGGFINLVFIVSSMISGACATPEFLMYLNYFLGKEYGSDYYENVDKVVDLSIKQRTIDKVITDCFEQVIYSINQPTGARNFQAVFWNISYYDRYYFESIFENFVFPDMTRPDWNGLNWLQKRFMLWFNKERTKTMLTFPVETMALLSEQDENGNFSVKDKEYADFTARMYADGHSFFTYLSDSADSLSSCCFTENTEVIIKNNKNVPVVKTFKDVYTEYGNKILNIYHNGEWNPGKCIQLPTRKMYRVLTKCNVYIDVSDNHIHVTNNGNCTTTKLKIGDKLKFTQYIKYSECDVSENELNLVMDHTKLENKYNAFWSEIVEITPIEYNKEIYCFEMEDKSTPYFTLANGIITHNCRLRNEIQDNEFSYTLGAGGISTGSKNVITININRCIQYATKLKIDYLKYLEKIIDLVHKVQIAYNDNLVDLLEKGMLPLYDTGYITLNRQYLTVGINGLLEGAEFLNIDISDNDEYANYIKDILSLIEKYNKQYRTKELMFNCEMVPAENLGVKHAKWDKNDGYIINRDCYNSYFYKVEDETTSIIDKIKLHGKKYIEHLTGGSACHINLNEHLSKPQYKKLLDVAAQEGCNYFTFNIPNTICNKCNFISKKYLKECPKCNSNNIDYITRIIGYIKRVSNFSLDRQQEANIRYYDHIEKQIKHLNINEEKTPVLETSNV